MQPKWPQLSGADAMMTTAEDKLAAHIAATVAAWPAPSPEQVRRVTTILRAAGRGDAQ